jgi:hypothetical protein
VYRRTTRRPSQSNALGDGEMRDADGIQSKAFDNHSPSRSLVVPLVQTSGNFCAGHEVGRGRNAHGRSTYPLHIFTAVGRAAMRRSSTNSGRLLTTSKRVRRVARTATKTSQPRATSAMVERARLRWMSLANARSRSRSRENTASPKIGTASHRCLSRLPDAIRRNSRQLRGIGYPSPSSPL